MKITFNQTPAELSMATEVLTSNVKRGTKTADALNAIKVALTSQPAGKTDPKQRGFIAALTTPKDMPADIELDLTAGQWSIFKDALILKAFRGETMQLSRIQVLSETAKTISVGLESKD
jgi:hypothetical protein